MVGEQPGDLDRFVAGREPGHGLRDWLSLAVERPGHVVSAGCRPCSMAVE
jgi:hypothetical protein